MEVSTNGAEQQLHSWTCSREIKASVAMNDAPDTGRLPCQELARGFEMFAARLPRLQSGARYHKQTVRYRAPGGTCPRQVRENRGFGRSRFSLGSANEIKKSVQCLFQAQLHTREVTR